MGRKAASLWAEMVVLIGLCWIAVSRSCERSSGKTCLRNCWGYVVPCQPLRQSIIDEIEHNDLIVCMIASCLHHILHHASQKRCYETLGNEANSHPLRLKDCIFGFFNFSIRIVGISLDCSQNQNFMFLFSRFGKVAHSTWAYFDYKV